MLHLMWSGQKGRRIRVAVNSESFIIPDNPRPLPKKLGGTNQMWYNKVMKHNRILFAISIIALAVLILMMNLISPTEIGPFGVLLFFTTIYISVFGIVAIIVYAFQHLAFKKVTFRGKDYLYSAIISFGPIMFLMARSFGAINLWTIALITLFIILAEFLVYKKV